VHVAFTHAMMVVVPMLCDVTACVLLAETPVITFDGLCSS